MAKGITLKDVLLGFGSLGNQVNARIIGDKAHPDGKKAIGTETTAAKLLATINAAGEKAGAALESKWSVRFVNETMGKGYVVAHDRAGQIILSFPV